MLAGRAIDRHEPEVGPADLVTRHPPGDDRGAVRGHVEALLGEADARVRRQVLRVADAILARRHRRSEQVPFPWSVVRVPMTDRDGLEQERVNTGLLPCLVTLEVARRVPGSREDRRRIDHDIGVSCGDHRIDAARRRRQQACLATVRRQQPQAGDLFVIRSVVRPAIRIRPARGEEDRAVTGERGRALTRCGSSQAARSLVPAGIQLPQRRVHLLAIGCGAPDADDQALAVG